MSRTSVTTYPHQGTSPCPRCPDQSVQCPCVEYDSVDIGIGIQTGNHVFLCETHGEFTFPYSGGECIFRDDAPTVAPRASLDDHEDDF